MPTDPSFYVTMYIPLIAFLLSKPPPPPTSILFLQDQCPPTPLTSHPSDPHTLHPTSPYPHSLHTRVQPTYLL